mgnify:CR=1 FL=1
MRNVLLNLDGKCKRCHRTYSLLSMCKHSWLLIFRTFSLFSFFQWLLFMFGNMLPFDFFFVQKRERETEKEREKEGKEEKKTVETSPNRQTKNKKKTFVVCCFLLVPYFLFVFFFIILFTPKMFCVRLCEWWETLSMTHLSKVHLNFLRLLIVRVNVFISFVSDPIKEFLSFIWDFLRSNNKSKSYFILRMFINTNPQKKKNFSFFDEDK